MGGQRRFQRKAKPVPADAIRAMVVALNSIEEHVDARELPFALDEENALESVPLPRTSFSHFAQECIMRLYRHAARRDGLPFLSMEYMRLTCLASLSCPTLRDALQEARNIRVLVSDGARWLDLEMRGDKALLTLKNRCNMQRPLLGDMLCMVYGLSWHQRMMSWLIGEDIKLSSVLLGYPLHMQLWSFFDEMFQVRPLCDQPVSGFEFSAAYLSRPIMRSYEELSAFYPKAAFDLLPPDFERSSFCDGVKQTISSALMRGEQPPGLNAIANIFGITVSTLRRRISDEGSSLLEIRRECRQQLSLKLLRETSLTIGEITYRLQFSDVSAFRRAFAAWLGMSPTEYRRLKSGVGTSG
jgi:AraC-like DNA-binding protein